MTKNAARCLVLAMISLAVVLWGCSSNRYARSEGTSPAEGTLGKIGKTISGTVKIGRAEFRYSEVNYGGSGSGPRGIEIWKKGTQGKEGYKLSPNPHDDPWYNNKNQSKFYNVVATQIATYYNANKATWPPFGYNQIKVNKIDYSLEQP